jgi:2-oxo-3-hexenedioate decarboxylase
MSLDFNATLERMLKALDSGALTSLPSAEAIALLGVNHGLTMTEAYALALELRSKRIARGERPVGYKIGFTNRTIWDKYHVHAPIWGTVWARNLHWVKSTIPSTLSLSSPLILSAPHIEPEVVFGFKETPRADANAAQLAACLEWVAFGFEIVHCHYANWQFTAPDTVIDFGLHAHLFVGPRVPLNGSLAAAKSLSQLKLSLYCNAEMKDSGVGSNVLDGPFEALAHFVKELSTLDAAPQIKAGDVVTTGTVTDAWPLQAGQQWRVQIEGVPLKGFELQVTE